MEKKHALVNMYGLHDTQALLRDSMHRAPGKAHSVPVQHNCNGVIPLQPERSGTFMAACSARHERQGHSKVAEGCPLALQADQESLGYARNVQ